MLIRPRARHGLKWYEIDMNWYGIWALKMLGLAKTDQSRQIAKGNAGRICGIVDRLTFRRNEKLRSAIFIGTEALS